MKQTRSGLAQCPRISANHEPLYQRLPSRDENGAFLNDFMMLIPGLKQRSEGQYHSCLAILQSILGNHKDVVYVDLNAPLNLLWISVRAGNGVIGRVADEIRLRIPEARLIGHAPIPKRNSATLKPKLVRVMFKLLGAD